MTSAPTRVFEPRHLQLARAVFAAIAALMVTFSPDHSADVGLAVFSGFAIATGLALAAAAWLVFGGAARHATILLALIALVAGMASGVGPWRSTTSFFVIVIAWATLSGLVEAIAAWRGRRRASGSLPRDGLTVGILTVVFGFALLLVPTQYSLDYYIEEAGRSFTLTGITIAVGVFGGYAAIVAVYLGIAGLSPRREPAGVVANTPTRSAEA